MGTGQTTVMGAVVATTTATTRHAAGAGPALPRPADTPRAATLPAGEPTPTADRRAQVPGLQLRWALVEVTLQAVPTQGGWSLVGTVLPCLVGVALNLTTVTCASPGQRARRPSAPGTAHERRPQWLTILRQATQHLTLEPHGTALDPCRATQTLPTPA